MLFIIKFITIELVKIAKFNYYYFLTVLRGIIMKPFFYAILFAIVLSISAYSYSPPDSCLKLVDYNGSDTTFTNIDSVKADSCLGSPTYSEEFAKQFFDIEFVYNIIPRGGLYPADTIIEYTWNNIDSAYLSTMLSFKQLELDYGTFHFREKNPDQKDTNLFFNRALLLRFDNYQCVDSAIKYVSQIENVRSVIYRNRGRRDTTSTPTDVETHEISKQLNYNTVTQMLTVNNQNITSNNYLQIYNLNGVEVKKVKITQMYQEINLYNLERGFYIIRYGNSIEKIIIQ